VVTATGAGGATGATGMGELSGMVELRYSEIFTIVENSQ
jgi:hypothetical protein